MLNEILDTLEIPFTTDLSMKQMFLAFGLFAVIAFFAFDTLVIISESM